MHVLLATGIYPPDIGGPATYVERLAEGLTKRGVSVTVVTYEDARNKKPAFAPGATAGRQETNAEKVGGAWQVVRVSKSGGPLVRWFRYAQALRKHGKHSDIIYAFSSISAGVPLFLSHLRGPRKILRLGGDFLWERYTDRGGDKGLREWYAGKPVFHGVMNGILTTFDHIVFSTAFQQELYEKFYVRLPIHGVIENALPAGEPVKHSRHDPFRLLFLGRFVSFKNLGSLVLALKEFPQSTLSLVGDGPLKNILKELVEREGLGDRVSFVESTSGEEKRKIFLEHDLLVLPSYTEISPNAALEARVAGLPVLLTEETGLSRLLSDGILMRRLRSVQDIVDTLEEAREQYDALAERASAPVPERGWDHVTEESLLLFRSLL